MCDFKVNVSKGKCSFSFDYSVFEDDYKWSIIQDGVNSQIKVCPRLAGIGKIDSDGLKGYVCSTEGV